jgi:hypothetical protein
MKNLARKSDLILTDLDELRSRRKNKLIDEVSYHEQHEILWNELRESDRDSRGRTIKQPGRTPKRESIRKSIRESERKAERESERKADKRALAQYGYKTFKAALRDGWHWTNPACTIGGTIIRISKNRTLAKGNEITKSKSAWRESGYIVLDGERPIGVENGPYGSQYWVYAESQVREKKFNLLASLKGQRIFN